MFRVIYLENDEVKHKGGFNQISEAMNWISKNNKNIIAIRLMVWNDYTDSFMKIMDL